MAKIIIIVDAWPLFNYCLCYNIGVANGDHNAQTITDSVSYKAVLDATNAQVIGPDYDEIRDEHYPEKSSEKPLHFEDRSVEFIKSRNDYFTLMPQEAQRETITNVNMMIVYFNYVAT
jgi:hypothetical protein